MSLRWRLTLWQVGLLAAVLMGFALVSYRFLANGLAAEIDSALRDRAEHVLDAVRVVPNRNVEDVWAPTDEFTSPGVYVQVLTPEGQVVAHSFNLGQHRLPVASSSLERALAGQAFYTTETIEGRRVRLYHQPIVREGRVVGVVEVGQSLQGLETTLRRLRPIYLVGIAGALILGGVVSWFQARLGLRRVTQVAQTAHRVAQSGNLKERLAYQGPQDEIGRLTTTFNLMMERLEAAFEAQHRFVADTAHELRTPLATILGNVDLLLRYGQDPQRRRQALASIKREGERTARLTADLLLLAQADAGQRLELGPVYLDEILIEVYEQAQGLSDGVHVSLGQCEGATIMGDPDRLKQMLLNLVDNALKYTDAGGRVTLSLTRDRDQARITVTDTGNGIPAADLPHIFERFYRVEGPARDEKPCTERHPELAEGLRRSSSTGLGLAIVKWIVEEHEGKITVESEVGTGSIFTVLLPIQGG